MHGTGRWRHRLWVNRTPVHDEAQPNRDLDGMSLRQLYRFVGGMPEYGIPGAGQILAAQPGGRPGDRWAYILEDRAGEWAPFATGNQPGFTTHVMRTEYGLKLPEGELSI